MEARINDKPRVKSTALESAVTAVIAEHLKLHGFRKTKGRFEINLSEDSLGFCALNVAKKNLNGGISINPIMGIIYIPIEDQIQRILHRDRHQATLLSALGYLTPESRFVEWTFSPDPSFDWKSESNKMARAIVLYGPPFLTSHAQLDEIVHCLEAVRFIDRNSAADRLPMAYLLQGKTQVAHQQMIAKLASIDDKHDYAATDTKRLFSSLINDRKEHTL